MKKLGSFFRKKILQSTTLFFIMMLFLTCSHNQLSWALPDHPWDNPVDNNSYVILGWNDLGMHCINPSYKELAILPPYNNLWVQVIKRGDPPQIVTTGYSVQYQIDNNNSVIGKTDFWTYANKLLGVFLPPGVGLTKNRLSGKMKIVGNHFEATGIPLLPFDDKLRWNPYQSGILTLKNSKGCSLPQVKTESIILPVSDEINCAKCHGPGGDGTMNITETGTVEGNILAVHDYYYGTSGKKGTGLNLSQQKPVLCAKCHSDNALNLAGLSTCKSLSEAMHNWHAQFPDAGCIDCHPGQLTQCLRTGASMGFLGTTPSCPNCHGGMADIANSISSGRKPWIDEPTCQQCHGSVYSTGPLQYKLAQGHGGLYCAACHNSPHAWWPSKNWADNQQPFALQGSPAPIGDCQICHTDPKNPVKIHSLP